MVVLPELGFPARAIVRSAIRTSSQSHLDLRGFLFSQSQVIAFDEIFHWVSERSLAFQQDRLAFDNAHFHKTPAQRARSLDTFDDRALARQKQMKSDGFTHFC